MTPEQSRSLKRRWVLGGIASAGQGLWRLGETYDKEQFRKKVEAREAYEALHPAEAAAAQARAASEAMAMGERFRLR